MTRRCRLPTRPDVSAAYRHGRGTLGKEVRQLSSFRVCLQPR